MKFTAGSRVGLALSCIAYIPIWPVAASAQGLCSNATLSGSYGFAIGGQILENGGPLAAVGRLEAGGDGTGEVSQTVNVQYRFTSLEADLSYTVNPDCTGNAVLKPRTTLSVPSIEFSFVLTRGGEEFYIIGTNDGTVSSGSGKKLGETLLSGCFASSFQGPYGYQSVLVNGDTATVSGVFVADGVSRGLGRDITNFNGAVIERDTSLSYTVQPNCLGRALFFNEIFKRDAIIDFVFVGEGDEYLFIQSGDTPILGVGVGLGRSL